MKVFALFSVLFFALFSINTFAADINLSWDQATTRVDGSAITGAKVYRLYQQVNNGATVVTDIPGIESTHSIVGVVSGVHTFQISTIEDTSDDQIDNGLEGALSDVLVVSVTDIEAAEPGKMLNFSFSFNCSGAGCSQEAQ